MKKILNSPENFVDEVVDGLLLAHPDQLRAVGDDRRALVRTDAGTMGRVGIVTGGGSGHLPLFLGYVGQGLASGVAVGNVFSSPSPKQILAATLASDDGAGVLYLYGNYGGDVYNFDAAADLAAGQNIRIATVLGTDDVLSAPAERSSDRRGVAGLVLAYKTAGAAAERGDNLDEVARIAAKTVARTKTMGVGLSPTILPAAGTPTFTLADGEMEIGIGIHGEPGHHRGPIESADQIADRFLDQLLAELKPESDGEVVVLVNGLGATPLEELYLLYRRVATVLGQRGVRIHRPYIGEYATSLEMAGASVSLLALDDELRDLIDAPARSPFFAQGALPPATNAATGTQRTADQPASRRPLRTISQPGRFAHVTHGVLARLPGSEAELRDLDAAVGDGDLGLTVRAGAAAALNAIAALPEDAHPAEYLRCIAEAFATANPSTFAALIGSGLMAASETLTDTDPITREDTRDAVVAMAERIMQRGKAARGDKTVVDVLWSVVDLFDTDAPPSLLARRCADAAAALVDEQTELVNRRGRAAWLQERSAGHPDPGSVAMVRALEAIADLLQE